MIWARLSEMSSIGRSATYASTFLAFFVFSILAATVKSWSGFLVVRFLQAFFGSPCLAIGGASMHDLFPDLTVPYSLAIWIAAAYCGPALGPLIASYLVPEKGWRWGMWEIVWLAAPTLILMVTLPETHGPTIRARRSNATGELSDTGGATIRTVAIALKDIIVRPVQITLQDPAVAVANLYTAFMYGTYYTFFDAIPKVYPERYGFTIGQLGLAFLSIFVACVVGGIAYCLYIYKRLVSNRNDLSTNHEASLRPALVASFLPPIGLFFSAGLRTAIFIGFPVCRASQSMRQAPSSSCNA
jgi:DHA1 family multidrug resistance protein-like MFS transporter